MPLVQDSPPPFLTTPCRDMGIDALGQLTDQIVAEVKTLVNTPPPLGNNYTDLLHSLRDAFEQGIAIVGGLFNAAAPIHHIPPELLSNIFALSPRAITHGNGQHQLAYWPFKAEIDVADLHKLTKVCRYWRDLAIATPTLWTTISTLLRYNNSSDRFRHSKYLPEDSSLDLTIHFNASWNRKEKMIEFILTKAPYIRELHTWGRACIPDMPSFLLSFDASALEHCTLWRHSAFWGSDLAPVHAQPLPDTRFLRFFSNGGARLRSLYLTDFDGLPSNRFPVLTLLVIASVEFESRINMGALLQFLAGCPQLEEVYIYDIHRCSSHTSSHFSPPISLPHLRYLYYTYSRRRRLEGSAWEEDTDPLQYLLSHTSIPATCHMQFIVHDEEHRATNGSILDSVCRHVQGKDAVSHLFLWLLPDSGSRWHEPGDPPPGPSSMQLVFPQGSLRLQFRTQFDCVDVLHSFPGLFSTTEDIRIRYDSALGRHADLERSLATLLPATFPGLEVLSLIPEDHMWTDPAVIPLHQYLVDTPQSESTSGRTLALDEADHGGSLPHPALDTLWNLVQSDEAIAHLEATLGARAALGFPIRCVIVHHCFVAGSTALVRLQSLDAEEVILTESRASRTLREVDWAVRLPDRFCLPPAIRRDWPAMWYRNDLEDRDGRQEDDLEGEEIGVNVDLDLDL